MNAIRKDMGEELRLEEEKENFFTNLDIDGYAALRLGLFYRLYECYRVKPYAENFNCLIRFRSGNKPCYGTIYIVKKFLFWDLKVNKHDLKRIKKRIDLDKNYESKSIDDDF